MAQVPRMDEKLGSRADAREEEGKQTPFGGYGHSDTTRTRKDTTRRCSTHGHCVTTLAALSDASKKHIALCFLGSSLINSHGNFNHPSVPSARVT
jgi:hypothetical protein